MKKGIISASILAGLAGLLTLLVILLPKLQVENDSKALGSVTVGNEYQSTTTPLAGDLDLRGANDIVTLKVGTGTLGQVVVTTSNVVAFQLYDATTSNVNLRMDQAATGTLLLADFPKFTATSTYTFDLTFKRGLLLVGSSTMATSTIMWR